ncbi:FecR family protein [Chitinophaga rhizosphaerae]|uniref:FecR family protein n=1 Tax=Chitinophaga rhizosphaerae TaxID=1864947 RepID=UPI0013E0692A|nr:FecR domain-containing protein [Chitinophaga rhizosphaerae]
MSRKVANEATAGELEELERLLVAEPGLHYTLNMVEELTPLPKPGDAATEDELRRKERGLGKLDELLAPAPAIRRRMMPRRWLAAAGVALLAGAGGVLYWMTGTSARQSVAETAFGVTRKEVLLPDGSRVVLNAGSKLTYDSTALANGERTVTLMGEGFFDVKASAEHPFVIRTGKVDVRVLGTTFNLKAYPKDNRVETFLITGKVEIAYKTKGEEAQVRLRPLERLVIDLPATGDAPAATLKPLPPETDVQNMGSMASATQTNPEPAWMQGRLEFENVTFEQLANELERWYNVSITLNNDKLKGEVFSGAFNNKPLPEVLQALQLTMQFQYKSLGDHQIEIW